MDTHESLATRVVIGLASFLLQINRTLLKTFNAAVIDPVGAGPAEYARVIAVENEAMARAGKTADLKAE